MGEVDFIRRRQRIEEALADVLRRIGNVRRDLDGNRILEIAVRRCEGRVEFERHDLWCLASELEAKLP